MSYSQAEIFNQAMGHVGINRTISDPNENSADARACRTHYQKAVDRVLAAIRWRFAERSEALAVVTTNPSLSWAFAYRAPTTFVCGWTINATPQKPQGEAWVLSADSSGPIILSNAVDALLVFTSRVSSTGLFEADFVDCVAWQLAIRIAQPLAVKEELRQAALKGYSMQMTESRRNLGRNQSPPAPPQCEFLSSRQLNPQTFPPVIGQ